MKVALAALALLGCADRQMVDRPVAETPPPTLAPGELSFSLLPINSLRGQVAGYDAAADRCVRVTWDFSNHGKSLAKHCDDFFAVFPYVSLSPGACDGGFEYAGNVDFVSGSGCIDFGEFHPSGTDAVDVTLHVSGPLFTGAIELHAP